MRKFFVIGLAILAATVFSTPAAEAQTGIGYVYQSHPLGIFYNMGNGQYLHGAVRFVKNDVADDSGSLESEFGVAGAWIMDMWSGSGWGFGPSLGAAWTTMSPEGDGDSASSTHLAIGLKGHWEATSNVSFWFGTGLGIDMYSPPVGDSTTDMALTGANIADLGFTVWLP